MAEIRGDIDHMSVGDVVSKTRSFMRRVARADQRAEELRQKARYLLQEMDLLPSVGVARPGEGGAGHGGHHSQVEAIAASRERMEAQRAALLSNAESVLAERAELAELLKQMTRNVLIREKALVLISRYLEGLSWQQVAKENRLPMSRCKKDDREGLLSIASLVWGLRADGCHYDEDGYFRMTDEQRDRLYKRWCGC